MFSDSFTYFQKTAEFLFSADSFGYVASFLVLATFCMRRMVPLRIVAIFSNIAFLDYGLSLGLKPVAFLHGLLLPINICRLAQAYGLNFYGALEFLCASRRPMVHFARVSAVSALLVTAANSATKDPDSTPVGPLLQSQTLNPSCAAELKRERLFSATSECTLPIH